MDFCLKVNIFLYDRTTPQASSAFWAKMISIIFKKLIILQIFRIATEFKTSGEIQKLTDFVYVNQ